MAAAAVYGAIIKQVSGHISSGARGMFNYMSAKRQLSSAKKMGRESMAAGLIDMSLENQRQEAATTAMRRVLGQVDAMYGESDSPKAQQTRRIIRSMVGTVGRDTAAPAAEAATQSFGARRLALRRAAALGPGGSALEAQKRRVVQADMAEDAGVRATRERAEYEAGRGFEDMRLAARQGGRDLGSTTADIHPPYGQIERAGALEAARGQVSSKWGPSIVEGVQSSIENLISAYMNARSSSPSAPTYESPGWVDRSVGARLDPREGVLTEEGGLRDMGPLEPEE